MSVVDLPLIKRGSVKNLRGPLPGKNEIVFEFSDDFSVFDWGKMPDSIPGKGAALLGLAAHLFGKLSHPSSWRAFFRTQDLKSLEVPADLQRELESIGMRSCFRGVYPNATNPEGLIVEKLVHPGSLIPLEVVFRHSLTDKSSFFGRNPGTSLKPGHRFETPLIEFFTKLEPTDRFISTPAEAQKIGHIDATTLADLELRSILLSLWLRRECALRDLELIDGKFEWGLDREGRLMLADAIGPDELRLIEKRRGFHADPSKEFLREYYRGGEWYQEIEMLKKSSELESGWQKTLVTSPPRLPLEAVQRATALYRGLERRFRPETVLLFGSGAREHAIARKLLDSPNLKTLIWAPGQSAAITALESQIKAGKFPNSDARIVQWSDGAYSTEKSAELIARASSAGVTLVVLSQDADLANGAADEFRSAGFAVFGPSREAARVEWSKRFTKELAEVCGIHTARSYSADSVADAERIIRELAWNECVVKADGLAAGKGVVVAESKNKALASLASLSQFGHSFVIEERLRGEESSWFAFSDGETFSIIDSAKDYKRLGDGQTGPNTGGMGAVSPAPDATPVFRERVRTEVFAPIFSELRKRGIKYQGVLYAGLMLDGNPESGKLALIEFNARFGDPETQALLPRMETDLLEWLGACAGGTLIDYPRDVPFRSEYAVYVVAAAPGYPEKPVLGGRVKLKSEALGEDFLRYAGLKTDASGWSISGGRVLGALGFASTLDRARSSAYGSLESAFDGGYFLGAQLRKDIGR